MRIAVGLGRERGEKELEASGVSRRDFMKFCTAVAVTMGFGPAFATDVAAALTGKRPSVVYLHEAECTGCSEALLRTASPFIDDLILDTISLDYHETIMAAAGEAAEDPAITGISIDPSIKEAREDYSNCWLALEAQVDSVQVNNAHDAAKSAWGVDVSELGLNWSQED